MKRNDLEYYDIHADQWWQEGAKLNLLHHFNASRFEFFDSFVPTWQGLEVLDVGCGGGLTCEFLARRGGFVTGIDLSPNPIRVAREHCKDSGLQIDYRVGRAENLPFTDNLFDAVVCVDVLEHVADPQKVVSEACRVLRKDGLFLFDTINRTNRSKFIMIWLMEDVLQQIPRGIHDWNKFIKPEELMNILEKSGFGDIAIKGFDLTNGSNFKTLMDIARKGLEGGCNDGAGFKIPINNDTRVSYIGKAAKL